MMICLQMTFKINFCYLIGSSGSKAGGAFPVFTEQNLQALVHVSPMSIIVAVAKEHHTILDLL